jgi:hypothetical protein
MPEKFKNAGNFSEIQAFYRVITGNKDGSSCSAGAGFINF